jgi:serine/threonine protein kinase
MEPLSANDPRVVGEFALRARLGSGGMGRVYLGFSPGGRAVAIKVVHPELARDPEFLRRFRQEVAAARAVSGMYTAPVVGSGVDEDPPWLATAYVPGPPLADVVSRHGPLAEAAVWRLAAGLADALRAVHGCGLVHRDLKPGNVLLAADGPHVIDFGISRAFEGTQLTSAGMVVGTPGYMSPEQAEGQQAGPPSDVFSLGCVLAYAAIGNAPFGGGSAASVLYRVVTAEPDLDGIPANLRQVIAACLIKDQAQRIGLAQLTAMISALGPPLPGTIGAFWPEPLAGLIAADQAPHPPTQVSEPVSPAQGGWTPATGRHAGAPGMTPPGMTPPSRVQPGPLPARTGHAPMVADGYYAAAAGNLGGAGAASPIPAPAPGQPQYGQPAPGQSWPPQYQGDPQGYASDPQPYPSGQQPGTWQQPSAWPQGNAAAPPAAAMPQTGRHAAGGPQSPVPGAQYGTPSWPQPDGSGGPGGPSGAPAGATLQAPSWPPQQPSSGGSWPGGGQPSGPGGASYPSGGTPLAQYAPGRRRPTKAELPPPVLGAARLMYLGAAVTALNVIFGNVVKTSYTNTANSYTTLAAATRAKAASLPVARAGERATALARADAATAAARHASTMAGEIGFVVGLGGLIGVVCWLVVAAACRRGRGWSRTAATVFLGLDTAGLLTILLGTHNDPAVRVTTVIVWIIGLAATIPLWGRQAREFFAYHSR